MLIVDSQVHIWAADTPERPWDKGDWTQAKIPVFGQPELEVQMKSAGIDRVVIVPPTCEGHRNDLALAAAQKEPHRFAVMGRLDPMAAASRGKFQTWRNEPGMYGVRFNFGGKELDDFLKSGGMDWVWKEAEEANVPLYLFVSHALLPLIDKVAERHPGLRIALDHLAVKSGKRDEEAFRDFDNVLAIAKRPNVSAKVSAMPCMTSDVYPYHKLHPYIRKAYDAFGPKRLFWGTDWSRMQHTSTCTYRQAVTMFTEEIPWLTAEDKEWMMGRGVCEWLGWKI